MPLGASAARRALLGAAIAGALAATPAAADVGPQGVRPAHNVTVFHDIDMVGVFGHAFGGQTLVEVFRGPHRIASVRGAAMSTAAGGGLEINHAPTVTPPLPGECWDGATPDVRPGDRVVVSNPGGATGVDEVIVDDIAIGSRRQLTVDPATGQEAVPVPNPDDPTGPPVNPPGSRQEVWVEGTARFGTTDGTPGAPIPLERLDSIAFIGLPADNQLRVLPSLVDAPNGPGTFRARYFAAPRFNVERNRSGRDNAYILDALTTGDAHGAGYGHGAVPPPVTMMVDGIVAAPGPALGCEAAPAYPSSAGSMSVRSLNIATAGVDATDPVLTVGGWAAFDVTDAEVVLTDGDRSAVSPVTLGTEAGEKGWSATFAKTDLDRLAQGALTAQLRLKGGATAGPVGATKTILYDLLAPDAPVASPGSGTYEGSQAIGLGTADPSAVVRYTTNGSDPTPTSAVAPAVLTVSRSQTIKAIAVDRAGNASAVRTFQYTITTPTRVKGADDNSGISAPPVIVQQLVPQAAVAGVQAAPVTVRALMLSKRVRASRLRSHGLRAVVGLDAETQLVRFALYRARGGRPNGKALAIGYRLTRSDSAYYRLRLRDRALMRKLKPGRYVLQITPGRSLTDLGVTRQVGFTVTA
jgi:hypothetical protein